MYEDDPELDPYSKASQLTEHEKLCYVLNWWNARMLDDYEAYSVRVMTEHVPFGSLLFQLVNGDTLDLPIAHNGDRSLLDAMVGYIEDEERLQGPFDPST